MLASDMGLFRDIDFDQHCPVELRITAVGSSSGRPDWSKKLAVSPSTCRLDRKGKAVIHASIDLASDCGDLFWFYLEPTNYELAIPLMTGPIQIVDDVNLVKDADELLAPDVIRPISFNPMDSTIQSIAITYEESDCGIHGRLWDSAYVLCQGLPLLLARCKKTSAELSRPLRVMDLGCGVGTVGILIASLVQSHIVLSDLPECLSLPKKNLAINSDNVAKQNSIVNVSSLPWGHIPSLQSLGKFDVIVAADVVYEVEYFDDLLRTLDFLSEANGKTEIWLVYKRRGLSAQEESAFFSRMEELFVDVTKDPLDGANELDPSLILGSIGRSIGCFLRRYRKN